MRRNGLFIGALLIATILMGELFERLGFAGRWGRLVGCGTVTLVGQILFFISGLRKDGRIFVVRWLILMGLAASICLIVANGNLTEVGGSQIINTYIHLLAVIGVISLSVWAAGKLRVSSIDERPNDERTRSRKKRDPFIDLY
jgi:hypothetical protein